MGEKNSERGIKRSFWGKPQAALVAFPPGWRDVCADEINGVLSTLIHPGKFTPEMKVLGQAILISGLDFRNLIELPLRLNTAREVLWILRTSHVGDVGDLRESLHKVEWDLLFHKGQKISARVDSFGSMVYHEGLMRDVLQEVMLRHELELVPPDASDYHVRLHLEKNRMTIGLALGGPQLYQRGYKAEYRSRAPLPEHVAAALTWFCMKWVDTRIGAGEFRPASVYVPFAGSGTLAYEALIYLAAIPPVLWREDFGFEKAPWFPGDTVKFCRKHLKENFRRAVDELGSLRVILLDKDEKSVADLNANCAKVQGHLHEWSPNWTLNFDVQEGDFFEVGRHIPMANGVFMPLNPPFGARLSQGSYRGAIFFERLAKGIIDLARRTPGYFVGYCLLPDESSWSAFMGELGEWDLTTRHFTLGGQDMRVVFFMRNTDGAAE